MTSKPPTLTLEQREQAVILFEAGDSNSTKHHHRKTQHLYNRWKIRGSLCLVNRLPRSRYTYEAKILFTDRYAAGETKLTHQRPHLRHAREPLPQNKFCKEKFRS